jgi:hypothetical protein
MSTDAFEKAAFVALWTYYDTHHKALVKRLQWFEPETEEYERILERLRILALYWVSLMRYQNTVFPPK